MKPLELWEVLRDMKEKEEYSFGEGGYLAYVTKADNGALYLIWRASDNYVGTEYVDKRIKWYKVEPQWEDCTREEAEQGLIDDTHDVQTLIAEKDYDNKWRKIYLLDNGWIKLRVDNHTTRPLEYHIDRRWQRRRKDD